MAKVTNAFDTYTATSDRESLSDVIYNISPSTTPFMSSIGKSNVKNVQFDWQTEALPTASGTGELEGFELSRSASTATVRESNICQISSRDATVTGSQQASDPAGKRSEMAHQLAIMAKALKRDMETALCSKVAKNAGNATTARQTGGFETWTETNVSRGTNGAGAGNGASASIADHGAVDFTKQGGIRARTFNESNLITCLSNDYGFENWLSKALNLYATHSDLLVLISVSGESENVVLAAQEAKRMGISVVTFSGRDINNRLKKHGDLNFWVNSHAYNIVECIHMIWITSVIDAIIGKAEYEVS